MSTRDFLERMRKAGEAATGGGAGIIGRIRLDFGVHRYVADNDFWTFFKTTGSEDDIERVTAEVTDRLRKVGCTDSPNFGLKVTIDKNVLGRPEAYKADLQEFIPSWQEDAFNLLFDYIDDQSLPIGEWFYGRVQYKANPFFVKQGEKGKKDTDQNGNPRFPSVRVPVEKFSSKEEAQSHVSVSASAEAASGWSEKAQANYGPEMDRLEKLANEILDWLEKAGNGTAFNNDAESYPLPTPPTPPNLKRYIADLYAIEPSDIDMLIPF